jgi:hypothetical protein
LADAGAHAVLSWEDDNAAVAVAIAGVRGVAREGDQRQR